MSTAALRNCCNFCIIDWKLICDDALGAPCYLMICIRRFRHSLICPMLTRMSDEFSEMDSHICLRCTSIFFKVQTLHMFVIFSSRSWLEWKRSPPSSWPGGTTGSRPTAIGTAFAFSRPSMSRGCPRGRANIVIIRERTTPETVRMRYTQRLNRWVSF